MDDLATASITHTVAAKHTALAVGSGDLEVLGTPVILAWCEAATCAALDLEPTQTSVGARVDLEHLAASVVGTEVTATATVIHTDGRLVRLQVAARDGDGTLLATGEIRRIIVDRKRFWARLGGVGD